MTAFLLDTDVVVITMTRPENLSAATLALLGDRGATRRISVVSAFEVAVKFSLGKLPLPQEFSGDFSAAFATIFTDLAASPLDVKLPHALRVRDLPFHHRDPFDRLLIAQAMEEDLTIVSTDRQFRAYEGLKLLPA